MKRQLFKSLILIIIWGFGIVIGTYAWFTSQAFTTDNVFETGELIIGVPYQRGNDGFISAKNLMPGASVSANLDVKNEGDVDFKYKVSSDCTDGDLALYNKLNISIDSGSSNIYNGPLKDLNIFVGNLVAKKTQQLKFTVFLPKEADNSCQGKLATAKFIFDATQIENDTWK